MDDFYSFLRPRTPDPSLNDFLEAFSDQYGQGVTTRRQARLAEAQSEAQPTVEDVGRQSVVEPQSNVQLFQPGPDVEQAAQQPLKSEAQVDTSGSEDGSAPYSKETLVASNGDVEAYCIKSFFRKMTNFT
jgi:hypothetical protein